MALRAVRRSTRDNALNWVVTTTQIAANVSAMLPFPPTMAAATLLLSILQIINDIKANQQECLRLAHRAAHLLTALGRRMEGKWDDAPQSLLENIREFEHAAVDTRFHAQGCANEVDRTVYGQVEHTRRAIAL